MSDPVLEVEAITVEFAGVQALQEVSFFLEPGRRLAVIGPNGAGKSTLVNCVTGAVRPKSGRVRLDGRPAPTHSNRLVRAGVSRTFQNLEIFGGLSVRENLVVGSDWRRHRDHLLRRPARRPGPSVDELLDDFGLVDLGDMLASLLPYGARKRVELARALVVAPTLLLLDEPAAGLDGSEKREIVAHLDRHLERYPAALLLIEHDMPTVRALCQEKVVVLDAGRKIAEGTFDLVSRDPAVVVAYLGDAPDDLSPSTSGAAAADPQARRGSGRRGEGVAR